MRREQFNQNKRSIIKRLTSEVVAVVFVLGMLFVPMGSYAVEPDAAGTEEPAAEVVEMTENPDLGTEQPTAEEEAAAEPQEADTEETADEPEDSSIDEVVEELNDTVNVELDSIDESEYDGFIYKLEDDTTKREIREMETAIDNLDESEGQEVEEVISKELYTADSIETIAEVADPSIVEYIEPDYIATIKGTNDPYYEKYGWHLEMVNAQYAWDRNLFGNGVTVAVLDTGVYPEHEDLNPDIFVKPYNVFTKKYSLSDVMDKEGHGTSVTGMIAASYNNGKGLTGVMPGVEIMPVKAVDDKGHTTTSRIIAGIRHAVDNGASVINMSIGLTQRVVSLETACNDAAAKGVILVAASGNEANDIVDHVLNPIEYPASYDSVISVGSVSKNGTWSGFSTFNSKVAVTAPGDKVFILDIPANNQKYLRASGTSFSTPQVAAMAAMIKQLDPTVDYKGFERILAATCDDKGAKGRDPYYGYGIMDLEKACRYMMDNDISMYDVILSATSFVYDGGVKTPSVTVKKANKDLPPDSYTVEYAPDRTAVGTYAVTITGVNGYTGKKTISFNIVPPLVKGIKKPQPGKKKLTVRWKAMSKIEKTKYQNAITGYQVRVATKSNFSNAKYVKVIGISKTKAKVKKLKKKKKYYVQYRSYKTVGSKTYYSKWSGTKKAKTK